MPPEGTEFNEHIAVAEDIFVEVSHGPTLMDNNIFLSEVAGRFCTQGTAMVHNLIAGSFVYVGNGSDNGSKVFPSPRYTPYHVPHRTEIAGFMTILHGDARFYNNIFVQQPISQLLTDYAKARKEESLDRMNYIVGTKPYDGEKNYKIDTENHITLHLVEEDGKTVLHTNLYQYLQKSENEMISTKVLGEAFEPEELFENPDGSPITFDEDYHGTHRSICPVSGPFEIYGEETAIVL